MIPFRTLFIVNRIAAPVLFTIVAATFVIPGGPVANFLQFAALVPFIVCCVLGAVLGARFGRKHFLEMRCPFCKRTGLVTRGVIPEVGWSLMCQTCGLVRPEGLLGLKFTKQEIRDQNENLEPGELLARATPQARSTQKTALCWLLAVGSLVVGATLLFGLVILPVRTWWKTRAQVQVVAQVQFVEGKSWGPTLRIVTEYTYQYGDRQFAGESVSSIKRSRDFNEQLSTARRRKERFQVYIDPGDPGFSTTTRGLNGWGISLIAPFSLAFVGIGIFLTGFLWKTRG